MTMSILEVKELTKRYPAFLLDGVSFELDAGRIMGFIGRNGAGKTTTLKSIFNLVHPDSGEIRIFGLDMKDHEKEIKQRVGYAGGAVDFYRRKKIKDIIAVTKTFYDNWDDEECRRYLSLFSIDDGKTPLELSEGMRVKLSLTLSLSHHAELLILDEPSSGLDPVSRAELSDVFLYLKEHGVSILFSTHITTDIEHCADDVAYIAKGRLIDACPMDEFLKKSAEGGCGTTLEEIMIHYEKERLI